MIDMYQKLAEYECTEKGFRHRQEQIEITYNLIFNDVREVSPLLLIFARSKLFRRSISSIFTAIWSRKLLPICQNTSSAIRSFRFCSTECAKIMTRKFSSRRIPTMNSNLSSIYNFYIISSTNKVMTYLFDFPHGPEVYLNSLELDNYSCLSLINPIFVLMKW